MSRPLLITDCDEVLLHMVVPFREWLDAEKGIHFDLSNSDFTEALRHKHDGTVIATADIWPLLDSFFETEMHRQRPIDGAVEAVLKLSRIADVVVLTNLLDTRRDQRTEQLRAVGLDFPVHTNQGGKGTPLARLIDQYQPSVAVFVDDLDHHHQSVAEHTPGVWRVHMVGEPEISARIASSSAAHVRLDNWTLARPWIEARFAEEIGAPDATHAKESTAP